MTEESIKNKLTEAFAPDVLELTNESHMHGGNRTDSHFKLLLVSDVFKGINRIDRQRKVNATIAEELSSVVHAFSQRIYTSEEWDQVKGKFAMASPDCLGGSKDS